MYVTRAFKSSNTVRLTLPRGARHSNDVLPGDLLQIDILDAHSMKLTNIRARDAATKKRKPRR